MRLRWYLLVTALFCLLPGWLYAQDNACQIREIRVVSTGPDQARFQVSYVIPPTVTTPCFIGAYVPDMRTPAEGFRYAPAGSLPEGLPRGEQGFNDAVTFTVTYAGPQSLATDTIEVFLFEKDSVLCSRSFTWDKTWEPHGSTLAGLALGRSILARSAVELEGLDRDRDGLIDELEGDLADACRPYLRFDSHEAARVGFEPLTLFQVRPVDMRSPNNLQILVAWALLYRLDGGYGPGSWCGSTHDGDIATARYTITSNDGGVHWTIASISLGPKGKLTWPAGEGGLETYGGHPVLYVSAGKHNLYFSKAFDQQSSPYSFWGCKEEVDGRGAFIMPDLGTVWGDVRNNVGEPEFHPGPPFINGLGQVYPGLSAWDAKNFYSGAAGGISRQWLSAPWQGGIPRGYRLQAYGYDDRFIRHRRFLAELTRLNSSIEKRSATFKVVPGLSDPRAVSFEAVDNPGYYLCNQDFRIKLLKPANESARREATFKKVRGLAHKKYASFESESHPGFFIRQRDFHIVLEKKGSDDQFRRDATFCVVDPD